MKRVDPVAEVTEARDASEVVRALEAARALAEGYVALSRDEVGVLEAQGNTCADWSRVKVAEGFAPEHVRGSSFTE